MKNPVSAFRSGYPNSLKTFSVVLLMAYVSYAAATDIADLTRKAEAGDANAQLQLADAYEKGTGVKQDDKLAFQWRRKAADQGNAEAQNAVGVMYSLGRGVEQSKEEALRWYKKAARQHLAKADYNVAISYYNGDGMEADLVRAYTWMMLTKRNGDPDADQALSRMSSDLHGEVRTAKLQLAELYDKGEEVPIDLEAAIALYRELAETNSKHADEPAGSAQYALCEHYVAGKGVPQDYGQAKSWCQEAGGNGEYFAFVVLARLAEQGLGGPRNLKDAEIWYRDAALMDVPEGFLQLAKLKIQSNSHDDIEEAYFWLSLAKQMSIKDAEAMLQEVSARLTPKERESEQKKLKKWNTMDWEKKYKQIKFP